MPKPSDAARRVNLAWTVMLLAGDCDHSRCGAVGTLYELDRICLANRFADALDTFAAEAVKQERERCIKILCADCRSGHEPEYWRPPQNAASYIMHLWDGGKIRHSCNAARLRYNAQDDIAAIRAQTGKTA